MWGRTDRHTTHKPHNLLNTEPTITELECTEYGFKEYWLKMNKVKFIYGKSRYENKNFGLIDVRGLH